MPRFRFPSKTSGLMPLFLGLVCVVGVPAQTVPAVSQVAIGVRLRLSGQVVYRIPARETLQPWANTNGLQVVLSFADAGGQSHRHGTTSATGGRLMVDVSAPAANILIPVADYIDELAALFAGSIFGPVPVRPVADNPTARVQRFDQLSVRAADGTATGIIQRRVETPSSNMMMHWIYSDRDVNIAGRATAPGVMGEIDLRLKEGWNTVVYALIYERGRDGQLILRSSREPSGIQWIYWQWRE